MTNTLTLPLVWKVRETSPHGDTDLFAGPLEIGCTIFLQKPNVWCAIGSLLTGHRSTNHPTREAAQEALEAAVMELGVAP